jgi:hypothetical protein
MKRGAAAPLTDLKITSSQKKIKLAEQHDTLAYADDLKMCVLMLPFLYSSRLKYIVSAAAIIVMT